MSHFHPFRMILVWKMAQMIKIIAEKAPKKRRKIANGGPKWPKSGPVAENDQNGPSMPKIAENIMPKMSPKKENDPKWLEKPQMAP